MFLYRIWLCACVLTHVWPVGTPWTVAHQAPLCTGFSRQEYWSGLACPCPADLPDPGTEPESPALAGGVFTTEPLGKPHMIRYRYKVRSEDTLLVKALASLPFTHIMVFILLHLCSCYTIPSVYPSVCVCSNHTCQISFCHEDLYLFIFWLCWVFVAAQIFL